MGILYKMLGEKYGRATVLKEVVPDPSLKRQDRTFQCQCDCGKLFNATGINLRRGNTTSCGCYRVERVVNSLTTHGHKSINANLESEQVYRVWVNIKTRCDNPNNQAYKNYGGRGIKLAPEWYDFAVFYAYVGDRPTDKHTIDRIDNDGGYEPGNVRWALREEQANNTRKNHVITYNGKTQTLSQWAHELHLPISTLYNRIKNKWPITRALETPARSYSR